jgi:hypothetical protein
MVGIIDAANSTTNNNNNKEYLIFGDITLQWFERLNKISKKKKTITMMRPYLDYTLKSTIIKDA